MAAGKVIPTELQAEAEALRKEIELDGSNLEESTSTPSFELLVGRAWNMLAGWLRACHDAV